MPGPKRDTIWYDNLVCLYQRTKELGLTKPSTELRNVLWDQVRSFVHGRVYDFIHNRKASILRKNPDLCSKLYQESFFIFLKACDIWDKTRKTKFMTFLTGIIDQEILNIIRMDLYYKTRDKKLVAKIVVAQEIDGGGNGNGDDFEKKGLLEEIHILLENFNFGNALERDIVYTTLYGKSGDWTILRKKSGLGLGAFYRVRKQTILKLREHILNSCDNKMKDILKEVLEEK